VPHETNIVDQLSRVFNALGVGWVMWLLIGLSVLSIAIVFERVYFFATHSLGNPDELMKKLMHGKLDEAAKLIGDRRGLEAAVVRNAMETSPRGAEAVEEIVRATIVREKLRYERFLSYLGTLGNNAPFVGLFGTVLGIIDAFATLALTAKAGTVSSGSSSIMSGISEALVATAVGIIVALPAVALHNAFGRWLQTIVARGEALGHCVTSHLKSYESVEAPRASTPF
jgi:biopolymer transport protein ExbB/TolQ